MICRSPDGGPATKPTELRALCRISRDTANWTVQEYQAKAVSADQLRGDDLAIPLLGLFGETGSLLSEAKKKHRDAVSYTGYEGLRQFDDIILGHGVSHLGWRGAVVEHPHDTPPFPRAVTNLRA
jgi:hypothetical protein